MSECGESERAAAYAIAFSGGGEGVYKRELVGLYLACSPREVGRKSFAEVGGILMS